MFPFPIRVLETGAPIFSANFTNSSEASAAIIPPPAYINGRLESFIKSELYLKLHLLYILFSFLLELDQAFHILLYLLLHL